MIVELVQGSPEWHRFRAGKITASAFADVMTGGKGKTRRSYMMRLIAERLTGKPQESFTSREMQWGIDCEPQARALYEFVTGNEVRQVGMVMRSEWVGCSPDGLVGDDGGIEIKCPNTSTHIGYCIANELPDDYRWQVQGCLWVTGRAWWDFVSFDPRLPQRMIHVVRCLPDEKMHAELAEGVEKFEAELAEYMEQFA